MVPQRGSLNILVAGGAGFLGSHLVDRLLELGHSVCVVDNLTTGNLRNLENAQRTGRYRFLNHDIVVPFSDVSNLTEKCFDVVFNFACPASPKAYQSDPLQTMLTNVIGTKNLLDVAVANEAVFIQASTSEIYGDPIEHPQTETYWGNVNSFGPRSCYDEGKRAAETLCYDYNQKHKLPIKVARIFNTYGPRMDANDGRVVSNFIVQQLRRGIVTIYGDGFQTRSFCYVDDLVEGFVALMESDPSFKGPVNLGNPTEWTINELCNQISEFIPDPHWVFCELPQDDPQRRCPDISLAKKQLRWEPKISLQQGLKRTIQYFRELGIKPHGS